MGLARLDNSAARRLFLDRHALLSPPSGPGKGADLLDLIMQLGFVQVDSVLTVERAHHMILHARRTSYRPAHLTPLLGRTRALFEHWTHDASVIPMTFLPHWRLRFERDAERLAARWSTQRRPGYERECDTVLTRIHRDGPCRTDDFIDRTGQTGPKGDGWWDWHPSKTALEYLWRAGTLAVCHRDGFRKVYDLAERVYPPCTMPLNPDETIDWACRAALDRLGFATSGELAAFWALVTPAEAKAWCAQKLADATLTEIEVQSNDGTWRRHVAWPGTVETATALPDLPGMIRVLSPFDPALRDPGKRAERLFGFAYRIEIFTPAAQRTYGYYVFPLLQGDRLIGRIDMAAERATGTLDVTALWPEAGVRFGRNRQAQLAAALARTARFAGLKVLRWRDDWLRDAPPVSSL